MAGKIKLNLSAFTLGLTSIIGQIIIIRELIVVFYGNELCLGTILSSWLFWVAFGSFVLGRFVDKLTPSYLTLPSGEKIIAKSGIFKEKLLSYTHLSISILLPLNIFFIRIIKSILKIPAGKIIGFVPMLSASFISLSVTCALLGFIFTLLSKLAAEYNKSSSSSEVGKVYFLEGLGASIGGILFSFFLIKNFMPFQNILLVGFLNLAMSILFGRNIIQLVYLLILSTSLIFNWPFLLDRFTRNLQFRPLKVVESIDSIYGNITVAKIGKDFSFYENGLLIFTSGDLLTSEESVQYAMLEHPLPKKVLLIGGGIGGSLNQILKHPVERLDYVELDPAIITLGEKYLSPVEDKRVNIIHKDGRLFVKEARSANQHYDIIILNLPDPYTAMLNRFYSSEFFGEIRGILSAGGVFSFFLTSSENYISPEHALYLSCIYNTLKREFHDIKTLPGDNINFLASNKIDILTYDTNVLINRLKERRIHTKFVREYYLPFKLHPLRIKYIESVLNEFRTSKINQDFKPIGYFYNMLVWISMSNVHTLILSYLEKINIYITTLIIVLLFLPFFIIQRMRKSSIKMPVILSVGLTGMSEICFQVIVILAFQFLYGYMYYRIGLILTSFMIGLVLGSFCINNLLKNIKDEVSLYIKTQVCICVYPLVLIMALILIAKINQLKGDIGNNLQFIFAFLPVIAGFLGGYQFPLANKICLGESQNVGKITGFLYGIDLLGSCIGGLLAGIILVPLLGIIQTCLVLSIINILGLILLKISPHN